jgi:hypothetical protein
VDGARRLMPKSIRWLDDAWAQLGELPEQLRKEALATAGRLMADPLPAESQTYEAVLDTYLLASGQVSLFYRVIGDAIDVVRVRPNS